MNKKNNLLRPVYLVDGARTPFLKATGQPGPFSAADLAVAAAKPLLLRQPFPIEALDEVICGCVMPRENEANIARIIALRLGCSEKTPAWTVQRNCASGMQALDAAASQIIQGRSHLVLAGGTEAMSHAPILYPEGMVRWLSRQMAAKTMKERLQCVAAFRLHYLKPVIALLRGLSDPIVGLSMGQTAENIACQFSISRAQMDEFALQSHQRVASAQQQQHLEEIVPLYDVERQVYAYDTGMRPDTNMAKLAKLPPFFDKKYGMVTAGNSSQVTDGAAFLLLASEEAVAQYQLPVLGKLVDVQWAALDPSIMGLAPVHASTPILQRHQLTLNDIDYWEINEAFAAQVLACLAAWQDDTYCQEILGLPAALGKLDKTRLNVDGGAIALGHPVGASGARIVLHLLHVLKRERAKRGMATLCIGGGQGGAMLIEVD